MRIRASRLARYEGLRSSGMQGGRHRIEGAQKRAAAEQAGRSGRQASPRAKMQRQSI